MNIKSVSLLFLLLTGATFTLSCRAQPPEANLPQLHVAPPPELDETGYTEVGCEVIIAGGSLAAFTAAYSSALDGAITCLIEPTDWLGGQLTASGVSAVDTAHHKVVSGSGKEVNVSAIARRPQNLPESFNEALNKLGNPGNCWVSLNCFLPEDVLAKVIEPMLEEAGANLRVYKSSVVKQTVANGSSISAVVAIQRTLKVEAPYNGYDRFLSEDLLDWYSPEDSDRFSKETIMFTGIGGKTPIVVDATEWGEILQLADAARTVGVEDGEDYTKVDNACGQSIVYPFAQVGTSLPESEELVEPSAQALELFESNSDTGSLSLAKLKRIWRYRRLVGTGFEINPEQISMQNWSEGNDYPYGYVFLSQDEVAQSVESNTWAGGVDSEVLAAAEQHALQYHTWFRQQARQSGRFIRMADGVFGTEHGLTKVPYMRDVPRSIGLNGFRLSINDISTRGSRGTIGTEFDDTIAIGTYAVDIHPLASCEYPDDIYERYDILPYNMPFRAFTNQSYGNLLVAGKTMASSFLVSTSARVHPIEWASGLAVGSSAAHMAKYQIDSATALEHIDDIQYRTGKHTPRKWSTFSLNDLGGSLF